MRNKRLGTGQLGFNPFRKIKIALKGLYLAIVFDVAVSSKVVLSVILLAVFAYFNRWVDFSLILVATSLMITAEIFNTAMEMLCDFVEAKDNPTIGTIKDILAGGVGVSILVWYIVIGIEIYRLSQFFI